MCVTTDTVHGPICIWTPAVRDVSLGMLWCSDWPLKKKKKYFNTCEKWLTTFWYSCNISCKFYSHKTIVKCTVPVVQAGFKTSHVCTKDSNFGSFGHLKCSAYLCFMFCLEIWLCNSLLKPLQTDYKPCCLLARVFQELITILHFSDGYRRCDHMATHGALLTGRLAGLIICLLKIIAKFLVIKCLTKNKQTWFSQVLEYSFKVKLDSKPKRPGRIIRYKLKKGEIKYFTVLFS